MDEERDAFYIVRKGDMVSIYKTLSDCQAQVSSSVCDPSVSVYKGYSLRKETEEYLASRGFKNPLYTIDASDLKEDLFGTIAPCPFQQPDGLAFLVDKTSKKLSPQKRSKEEAVGSSLLSTEQKHLKPGFTIEAQPIRCRYNTVKPSQDACWEENEKLKAIWDDSATDIFIKICVGETLAGNRPNGHFSKLGWKNVINKFNDMTGRPYRYKQLKNKWTSLKKDWQIWTALVGNETDMGWDLSRQTIDASNEWWDKKSKEIPEAIKFRTKGLKNVDQLDFLFKNTVVTGEGAWAPSQGLVAHDIEDDPSMMGGHDDNLIEAQWNLGFDVETKDNLENIVTDVETSTPTIGAPTQGRGKKRKKVGLRAGVTTRLSQKLDRICEAVESRTSNTSRMTVKPGCSIAEVMELLRNIPEVVDDVELYMKATDIFLKRENREMFLALQKPDIQIAWLKRQKI